MDEGDIALGRPYALSRVYTIRSKSLWTKDKSIGLRSHDRMKRLNLGMECDGLHKAMKFNAFELKGICQSDALLLLASTVVKTGNCGKMDQEGESKSPQEGKSSPDNQRNEEWDGTKHREQSSTSAGKKRSTDSAGHPNDDDDLNDSDEDGDKLQPPNKRRVKESDLKFACPFYKYDPERFKNTRSCMGPGWVNVQRVKSHCEPPFKCLRCSSAFKAEDELRKHLQKTVPCSVSDPESQGRDKLSPIDAETEKRLRSRNKASKTLTEAERWFNMYQIIFPNHPSPLSPYHSPPKDDTEDLVQLFSRSIRPRFEDELRLRLERAFTKSTIVDHVIHEAMAAFTTVIHGKYDSDGRNEGLFRDTLQNGIIANKSSVRTEAAKNTEFISPRLENGPIETAGDTFQLASGPLSPSFNGEALTHQTEVVPWRKNWLTAMGNVASDSSSGFKDERALLRSVRNIQQEMGSSPVPQLIPEAPKRQGTDILPSTSRREPWPSPSPDIKQPLGHEGPSRCSSGDNSHQDVGDSSRKHLKTRHEVEHETTPWKCVTSFDISPDDEKRGDRECWDPFWALPLLEPGTDFDSWLDQSNPSTK
ncbi:hypothetical protein FGADI_2359 [Fusarium gaditjirri]|uniref:C2H2-type domain-containing protein n=1 Tax=Fusarium gaditjirri TaxID=282569 RepID=A0A8H4TIQ9_9HYPO|nr:hypothetical protein FGADI_2359 [Fusarium gaditjirri]